MKYKAVKRNKNLNQIRKLVIDVTLLAITCLKKRRFRISRWKQAVQKLHAELQNTNMDRRQLRKFEESFQNTVDWMTERPRDWNQSVDQIYFDSLNGLPVIKGWNDKMLLDAINQYKVVSNSKRKWVMLPNEMFIPSEPSNAIMPYIKNIKEACTNAIESEDLCMA